MTPITKTKITNCIAFGASQPLTPTFTPSLSTSPSPSSFESLGTTKSAFNSYTLMSSSPWAAITTSDTPASNNSTSTPSQPPDILGTGNPFSSYRSFSNSPHDTTSRPRPPPTSTPAKVPHRCSSVRDNSYSPMDEWTGEHWGLATSDDRPGSNGKYDSEGNPIPLESRLEEEQNEEEEVEQVTTKGTKERKHPIEDDPDSEEEDIRDTAPEKEGERVVEDDGSGGSSADATTIATPTASRGTWCIPCRYILNKNPRVVEQCSGGSPCAECVINMEKRGKTWTCEYDPARKITTNSTMPDTYRVRTYSKRVKKARLQAESAAANQNGEVDNGNAPEDDQPATSAAVQMAEAPRSSTSSSAVSLSAPIAQSQPRRISGAKPNKVHTVLQSPRPTPTPLINDNPDHTSAQPHQPPSTASSYLTNIAPLASATNSVSSNNNNMTAKSPPPPSIASLTTTMKSELSFYQDLLASYQTPGSEVAAMATSYIAKLQSNLDDELFQRYLLGEEMVMNSNIPENRKMELVEANVTELLRAKRWGEKSS